jgi:biotin transport system substrate-specific component
MWWGASANVVGGIVVVYAIGIPVQAAVTGTSGLIATAAAAMVFLPGDLVKAAIATVAAGAVHRGYPGVASAPAPASLTSVTSR